MKKAIIVNSFIFGLIFILAFFVSLMLLPQITNVAEKNKFFAPLASERQVNHQAQKRQEIKTPDLPLQVPEDFEINSFAENLGKARDIIHNPSSGLLLSVMDQGKVVLLRDNDFDNQAEEQITILEDLYNPHGILTYCREDVCKLYVAETSVVSTYDYYPETLQAINRQEIIDLPDDGGHYTRSLLYTTIEGEDKLFVSVGSSCNVCDEEDDRRSKIFIANMDGSDFKEYARGLRNSVFMTQHPVSGEIWATEMGRDWLGDDLPPDEVNIIQSNEDYGWPLCYGDNIHDSDFDKNKYIQNPCANKQSAKINLPAHVAPLGLAFIPEEGYQEDYWYDLLVAFHGSWNRSQPSGYQVIRFKLDENGNLLGQKDFVSTWIDENEKVWGRPVDILVEPGGRIYISDDYRGAVYVVTRKGEDSRIEVNLRENCEQDSDCTLPAEYAIRSSCPFEARCLRAKCHVVCPSF